MNNSFIESYRPYIKVCCIASAEEMRLAVRMGASAVGLVSAMPSGPGPIADALIAEIARATPPPVATFLLTSETSADAVIAQHAHCRTSVLQLVDRMEDGALVRLRHALPGVKLVQVIHVGGEASVDEAREVAPFVDGLLLDSGNPSLAVKELGGTGRVHDWAVSRRIVEAAGERTPVFLAGGLTAENVGAAIRDVRPWGLDLCSHVRADGALDAVKLGRFMESVRAALPAPPA